MSQPPFLFLNLMQIRVITCNYCNIYNSDSNWGISVQNFQMPSVRRLCVKYAPVITFYFKPNNILFYNKIIRTFTKKKEIVIES